MNFRSACSLYADIGGIHREGNKSQKLYCVLLKSLEWKCAQGLSCLFVNSKTCVECLHCVPGFPLRVSLLCLFVGLLPLIV